MSPRKVLNERRKKRDGARFVSMSNGMGATTYVPSSLPAGLAVMAALATIAGCVTPPPIVLHSPVGPQHQLAIADGKGRLLLYSATRVTTSDQSEYPIHTPYTIYGRAGAVIRKVVNTSGLFSRDPEIVSLPAGEYTVKALAAGAGFVVVPVIIEPRETTVVDLDGTAVPQGIAASNDPGDAGRWVRLPDGHIVGSSSKDQ